LARSDETGDNPVDSLLNARAEIETLHRQFDAVTRHRARLSREFLDAARLSRRLKAQLAEETERHRAEVIDLQQRHWAELTDRSERHQAELAAVWKELVDTRAELYELQWRSKAAEDALSSQLAETRARWAAEIAAVQASTSWRVTAPLRRLAELCRKPAPPPVEPAPPPEPEPEIAPEPPPPVEPEIVQTPEPVAELPAEPAAEPEPVVHLPGDAARLFRVAVVAHVYYIDLLDEMLSYLRNIPVRFTLFVSVTEADHAATLRDQAGLLRGLDRLDVRIVPNRGRDIGPLFATFGAALPDFDLVCHLHTKKSLQLGQEAVGWRRHLFDALVGPGAQVATILDAFAADPGLGIVYPKAWEGLSPWAFTWLSNKSVGRTLFERLGIAAEFDDIVRYPVGSMFWARSAALAPLIGLGLTAESFPVETGQSDGALQHAIERSFALVAEAAGFSARVIGADDARLAEDDCNFTDYALRPTAARIAHIDPRISVLGFGIYETLLVRPFAGPAGRFAYVAETIARDFGLADFADARSRAEHRLRGRSAGAAITLEQVYASMIETGGLDRAAAPAVMRREIEIETTLVAPRVPVIEAAWDRKRLGTRIVLIADTLLPRAAFEAMLMRNGIDFHDALYLSSELGATREGRLWDLVLEAENVPLEEFAHVGDDEILDLQATSARRLRDSIQVMRPLPFGRHVLAPRERAA
jgi:FMN phosphatase YigB (HAD superfamily)